MRPRYANNYGRKRSSYKKGSRGRKTSSSISGITGVTASSLRVYLDPFSMASTAAKIPDGKALLSVGVRLQSATEFTNDSDGLMHFVMYPGFGNGLHVNGVGTTPFGGATGPNTYAPYDGHGTVSILGSDQEEILSDNDIASWRLVSQGLKLSLVNTYENNDGWFEAVRYTQQPDTDRFALVGLASDGNGDVDARKMFMTTTGNGGSDTRFTESMVGHPSYVSGKLQDLSSYMFSLKPHMRDHDFLTVSKSYRVQGNLSVANQETAFPSTAKDGVFRPFIEENIDLSWDFIYIRVHGRSSVGGRPTRILAHTICNQEVVYRTLSTNSRFHTKCNTSIGAAAAARAVAMGSAAAGINPRGG